MKKEEQKKWTLPKHLDPLTPTHYRSLRSNVSNLMLRWKSIESLL